MSLRRGDATRAARELEAGQRELRLGGSPLGADWMASAEAALLEFDGKPEAAWSVVVGMWDLLTGAGVLSTHQCLGPEVVRRALAVGDRERAAAARDLLTSLAARTSRPSTSAIAAYADGLVRGDPHALRRSADHARAARRPLLVALAAEAEGEVLLRRGSAVAAREPLLAAVGAYDGLGAAGDAARVAGLLRRAGGASPVRRSSARPVTGFAALTRTESEVVDLLCEGLSNPEIGRRLGISRRTVGTHLSHVYQKLSVGSRTEVVAMAVRRPA